MTYLLSEFDCIMDAVIVPEFDSEHDLEEVYLVHGEIKICVTKLFTQMQLDGMQTDEHDRLADERQDRLADAAEDDRRAYR